MRLIYLRRKFVPTYNLKTKQLFNSNGLRDIYICTVLTKYSVDSFSIARNEHQLFLLPTSVFPTTSLALGYWDLRATSSLRVVGWIHITRSPLKHSCFCCLLLWVCKTSLDRAQTPRQPRMPTPTLPMPMPGRAPPQPGYWRGCDIHTVVGS